MEETTMKRMSKLLTLVLALCLLLSVSAFASAEPASAEPAAGVVPGTYTDGTNTLVIADDLTFIMYKDGENMDGATFAMTVVGTVTPDAVFTITGIFDGELDVFSMAAEYQIAADLESIEACYAAGAAAAPADVVPGTYTDGTHTLVIADDMTFTMKKAGENMDGASFEMTVNGTVTADGVFTITALLDGDIDVFSLATEDQIAGDLATVEEVYAAATAAASGEPSGEPTEADYQAYLIEFVNSCEDIQTSGAAAEFIAQIQAGDYVSFPVEMLFNAQWFGEAALTLDEFLAAGGNVTVAEHPSNGAMLDGTSA